MEDKKYACLRANLSNMNTTQGIIMDKDKLYETWKDFKEGKWMEEIDVRNFILTNYTPYDEDSSFLEGHSLEGYKTVIAALFYIVFFSKHQKQTCLT